MAFKLRGLLLILLAGGFSSTSYAGNADSVFKFAATFNGGSCEVSVPASLTFNQGQPILPSEIAAGGEAGRPSTTLHFNLTLNHCSGQGLTPKIEVSGKKELICGSTSFANALTGEGSALGYGIYLRTAGNEVFSERGNLAYYKSISPKNWSTNSRLESLSHSVLPITAVLRTGTCSDEVRRSGEFRSSVTFDFIYE